MGASRGGKKPLHTALILVFPASVHDKSTEAGSEAKVLLPVWYSIAGADCRQLDLYNHIRLLCSALFCAASALHLPLPQSLQQAACPDASASETAAGSALGHNNIAACKYAPSQA